METSVKSFTGILNSDNQDMAVELFHASRFSVFVKFQDGSGIRDGKWFKSLVINLDGRDVELGFCRFILETTVTGINGRLIFINDVYNFDALFKKQDFINLERLSKDLMLILAQKEKVKNGFREYVSRLTFDLKVYKHFFDGLDRMIAGEPEPVREHVSMTILNTEGRKFMDFFANYLAELEEMIRSFSREEHETHGFYLRKQVWDIILSSEFMTRTNLKPRGYAGDSEMMRMIYENSYRGNGTFSRALYKFSLEHPAAQAVRNRRVLVPRVLRNVQDEFSSINSGVFKFISIACGPAYELNDIFTNEDDVRRMHCTLMDQDDEAIREAGENINQIEKRIGYKVNVSYLKDSVRTMLMTGDLTQKWGKFNYIYSMGLFDYLTPPVAKAVAEKLYSLLEPGGKIFIGNFHFNNKSRWFMEYWHDWVLYYRSEDDFYALFADTDAVNISVTLEDTGSQMFLLAQKPEQG